MTWRRSRERSRYALDFGQRSRSHQSQSWPRVMLESVGSGSSPRRCLSARRSSSPASRRAPVLLRAVETWSRQRPSGPFQRRYHLLAFS